MDLKLTTDHDIYWHNGPANRSDFTHLYTEKVGQRLKIRLLTFQEEYFWNLTYGVPWWQKILGKKISKSALDLLLQQQILLEEGVKEITYFQSTFVNRKYSLVFRVKCVDGQITAPISITP